MKRYMTKSKINDLQFGNFVTKLCREKQNLDEFLSDFSLPQKKIKTANMLVINGQKELVNPDTNIPYFWHSCILEKCDWEQIQTKYQDQGYSLSIAGIRERFNNLFRDKLILVSKEMGKCENSNIIKGLKQFIIKRIVELSDMMSYKELAGVSQLVQSCGIIVQCITYLINNYNCIPKNYQIDYLKFQQSLECIDMLNGIIRDNISDADQQIIKDSPICQFFFQNKSSQEVIQLENEQLCQDNFSIELENEQMQTKSFKKSKQSIELENENENPKQDFSMIPFFKNSALDLIHQTCSICQIDYEEGEYLQLIQCTHRFHVACLRDWKKVSNKCPVCKYRIE